MHSSRRFLIAAGICPAVHVFAKAKIKDVAAEHKEGRDQK
jgi:hypothetical protein